MNFLKNLPGYIAMFFSSGILTGFIPWLWGWRGKGGGTIGSAVTTIALLCLYSVKLSFTTMAVTAAVTLLLGWVCTYFGERQMLRLWGPRRRHTGLVVNHDFNETNIDEIHGMLIAVLPIYLRPLSFGAFVCLHLVALIFFRVFDATKFGPVGWAEKETERLGKSGAVMLDDTMAGLLAVIPVTGLCLFIANL